MRRWLVTRRSPLLRRSGPLQNWKLALRRSAERRSTLVGWESQTCQYDPSLSTKVRYDISMTSRGCLTRFASHGVQEKCHHRHFPDLLNICFVRGYRLNVLPAEARQSFAHNVDHGLGRPAVVAVVEERKRQNFAVNRRHVACEPDDLIGGARLGVKI